MGQLTEGVDIEPPEEEWEVCGDCRRAYRGGEHHAAWVLHEEDREEELVELCPYHPDCEAQPRFDGIEWADLVRANPDSLPSTPERGIAYVW